MEQIASDTSSYQDQDSLSKFLNLSFQKRRIKVSVGKRKQLSGDQVMRLIFLIATFIKPKEIIQIMKEEFKVDVSPSMICNYRNNPDYQNMIQKIRTRWGNDLLHVEFANKRRRLEELESIYKKCFTRGEMKNAMAALYQIQHEIEKDLQNLSLTNYNVNIYKNMSNEELERERLKSLERLKTLKGECVEVKSESQESKE